MTDGYIKTLMALTALTISGACFAQLRGPDAFTRIAVVCWLALNVGFGYKLWKVKEDEV